MNQSELLEVISQKGCDVDLVAAQVIEQPTLLPQLIGGLQANKATRKYTSEKVLRAISLRKPALLYPHFDFFVSMMDHENSFLKWGAILTVANLTCADTDQKFEKIFKKYFAPISGSVLVTAANVIGGAAVIAQAKPELTEKISKEILKVQHVTYKTPECRNVAIGHAITSFNKFFELLPNKEPVLSFVEKQLSNSRNAVQKKATKFMRKYGSS